MSATVSGATTVAAVAPTPPEPGLVQKRVNGVLYWQDTQTRKLHSPVALPRTPRERVQAHAAALAMAANAAAASAPTVAAASAVPAVEAAVENLVHAIAAEIEHEQPSVSGSAS